MAQPLDFSPLDMRAQIYQDRALKNKLSQELIRSTTQGVLDVVDWQRDMRQQFEEASEFDHDITLDAQANSWLGNYYEEKIKNEEIQSIIDKKWKTQSHVNKMMALQEQMGRTATNMKSLVQLRQQAEQKAMGEQSMLYEMDTEKVKQFEDFLTGKIKVNNANAFLTNLMRGENGEQAFLKTRINNVDPVITQTALKLAGEFEEIKKTTREQVVGDKLKTTITEQREIDRVAQENFGALVLQEIMGNKQVQGILPTYALDGSNKVRQAGLANTTNMNDLQLYITDVFDYNQILAPSERVVEEKVQPYKEKADKSKDVIPIKETDIGWDFGSTPISLTKEVSYVEDGKEKTTSLKNASVIAVNKRDGNYVALINIPRDPKKESAEYTAKKKMELEKAKTEEKKAIDAREDIGFLKKRSLKKDVDKKYVFTEEDKEIASRMMVDPDKTKVIEVPLDKALHGELKAKFKKMKLNLEGFNQIDFSKVDDSKDGFNTGGLY
jgi:hypothetical protein